MAGWREVPEQAAAGWRFWRRNALSVLPIALLTGLLAAAVKAGFVAFFGAEAPGLPTILFNLTWLVILAPAIWALYTAATGTGEVRLGRPPVRAVAGVAAASVSVAGVLMLSVFIFGFLSVLLLSAGVAGMGWEGREGEAPDAAFARMVATGGTGFLALIGVLLAGLGAFHLYVVGRLSLAHTQTVRAGRMRVLSGIGATRRRGLALGMVWALMLAPLFAIGLVVDLGTGGRLAEIIATSIPVVFGLTAAVVWLGLAPLAGALARAEANAPSAGG